MILLALPDHFMSIKSFSVKIQIQCWFLLFWLSFFSSRLITNKALRMHRSNLSSSNIPIPLLRVSADRKYPSDISPLLFSKCNIWKCYCEGPIRLDHVDVCRSFIRAQSDLVSPLIILTAFLKFMFEPSVKKCQNKCS